MVDNDDDDDTQTIYTFFKMTPISSQYNMPDKYSLIQRTYSVHRQIWTDYFQDRFNEVIHPVSEKNCNSKRRRRDTNSHKIEFRPVRFHRTECLTKWTRSDIDSLFNSQHSQDDEDISRLWKQTRYKIFRSQTKPLRLRRVNKKDPDRSRGGKRNGWRDEASASLRLFDWDLQKSKRASHRTNCGI